MSLNLEPKKVVASGPGGKIDRLLETLGDDDRDALFTALTDPEGFPSRYLASTLRGQGHFVSATTIKDWRTRHGV